MKNSQRKMSNKRQRFNETRCFIAVYSIFGLWPSFSTKSKYKIFLIFLSLAYIGYTFFTLWFAFYLQNNCCVQSLSALIQFLFELSILLAHFTVMLEALINRNAQMYLIEKFSHIDWLLRKKFQIPISYHKEKYSIFIYLSIVEFIWIFIRTILTFHINNKYEINNLLYPSIFSTWVLRLRFNQIIFFIYLLRNRLRLLRDQLNELLVTCTLNVNSKNRWRFYHDASKIFVLDITIANRSLYDRLLNVKQLYGELHEICELLNRIFGWSLLCIIAQSFFDFSINSYWIYMAFEKSNSILALYYLIIIIPIAILLISMVNLCSSCSRCVSFICKIYKLLFKFYSIFLFAKS